MRMKICRHVHGGVEIKDVISLNLIVKMIGDLKNFLLLFNLELCLTMKAMDIHGLLIIKMIAPYIEYKPYAKM